MTKRKVKLTPPDKKRCQHERLEGSFMTLGPRSTIRCEKPPTVIATEKAPGADGLRGSMSLCDEHDKALEAAYPGRATRKPAGRGVRS